MQRAAHAPCRPQPTIPTVRASGRERLGRDRRDRAGPQGGDRPRVEQHQRLAGGGVRQADHAGHRRQPLGRVARERRDPLDQRQPVAAGRHRPEVAVRRALQVDLRRHHPVARVMAQERLPDAVDRLARGDRREHGVVVENRDLGHGCGTIPSPLWSNRRPEAHDRGAQRVARGGCSGRRSARAVHARDRATPGAARAQAQSLAAGGAARGRDPGVPAAAALGVAAGFSGPNANGPLRERDEDLSAGRKTRQSPRIWRGLTWSEPYGPQVTTGLGRGRPFVVFYGLNPPVIPCPQWAVDVRPRGSPGV